MEDLYELYADEMRECSNMAHALARRLRYCADIAPEESVVGPCVNMAAFLDQEAHSMNPDKGGIGWVDSPGKAEIISFEEEARRRGRM